MESKANTKAGAKSIVKGAVGIAKGAAKGVANAAKGAAGAVKNVAKKAPQKVNPLDVKAPSSKEDSTVIKNIVSTETSKGEERILEAAPEVDVSLMQEIAPPKSALLLLLKTFFGVLVVTSIASLLFFTSQLSDTFDFATSTFGLPSVTKDLSSTNSEITGLQTGLNFYRYLQIKAFLDEFTYYGDSYILSYEIANSQTAENKEKKKAVEKMAVLRDNLRESFMKIKDKLILNFTAPLIVDDKFYSDPELQSIFENELNAELTNKANELINSTDPQAKRDYKNYSHTIRLIGNTALKNMVVSTDFDTLSDGDLYNLIKDVDAVIVNDLSIIQTIKDNRIRWSDIMNEIDLRTMAVDTYYSDDFYEEIGGIRYTSYDFDSSGPSISIVGETKRFDTTNFTMIANLIDELNRSELFENGEMRSFSKSGSLDSGYTASLQLNLDLEGEEVVPTVGEELLPPGLEGAPM